MGRVYALLATVTLISGLTHIAARLATQELPPLTLAPLRFGLAGIALTLTLKLLGQSLPPIRREWKTFLGLGALCVPINQVCFLFGVRLANATHSAIWYALVPVMVFWISVILGRARFSFSLLIASALASLGAIAIVTAAHDLSTASRTSLFLAGDPLLFGAALSWSVYAVTSQPVVRRHGAMPTLAGVFLVGSMLHLPLIVVDAIWFDLARFEYSSLTWRGPIGFLYITFITAYLNYLLWYYVVAKFDVTRSTVVTNASFVVTVSAEMLLFGTTVAWWGALGCVILLGGIVMAGRGPQAQAAAQRLRDAQSRPPALDASASG